MGNCGGARDIYEGFAGYLACFYVLYYQITFDMLLNSDDGCRHLFDDDTHCMALVPIPMLSVVLRLTDV